MPATRDDLIAFLAGLGIAAATVEHPPLFTVEESRALRGEIPGAHTKNLFLKDKKDALFLVVAREESGDRPEAPARADRRRRPPLLRQARTSARALGVTPGAVTAFGLINDRPAASTSCSTRR